VKRALNTLEKNNKVNRKIVQKRPFGNDQTDRERMIYEGNKYYAKSR